MKGPANPLDNLAANLRHRMWSLELTELEVAARAGVSRTTLRKMLGGQNAVRTDSVARVASAVHTTPSSLLDPRGPRDRPVVPDADQAPPELSRILAANLSFALERHMCEAAGVARSTFEDVRAGKSNPTLTTLAKLGAAVGLPAFALLHPCLSGTHEPRVLLVDDNPQVLAAMRLVLQGCEGIRQVTSVTAPGQALVALRKMDFCAVVADYQLGVEMNGIDVLREARRTQPWARRILLSGTVGVAFQAATGEIDAILRKPIGARALLAAVLPDLPIAQPA